MHIRILTLKTMFILHFKGVVSGDFVLFTSLIEPSHASK